MIVFFDTNPIIKTGFKFDGSIMSRIKSLASAGAIKILISDVVRREILKHMKEKVDKEISPIKDVLRSGSPFCNFLPRDVMLSDLASAEVSFMRSFSDFLENANVEIVESSRASIDELMNQYFSKSLPFADGKKSEFPDAISLLALDAWAKNVDEVYVVTSDKTVLNWCEERPKFIPVEKIEDVIKKFTSSRTTYNRIQEIIAEHPENICDFLEFNHSISSFRSERSGAIVSKEFSNPVFSDFNVNIINIDDDNSEVDITIHFLARYDAEVEVETEHYDEWRHEYFTLYEEGVVSSRDSVSFRISVDFQARDFEILSGEIDYGNDARLRIFESDL